MSQTHLQPLLVPQSPTAPYRTLCQLGPDSMELLPYIQGGRIRTLHQIPQIWHPTLNNHFQRFFFPLSFPKQFHCLLDKVEGIPALPIHIGLVTLSCSDSTSSPISTLDPSDAHNFQKNMYSNICNIQYPTCHWAPLPRFLQPIPQASDLKHLISFHKVPIFFSLFFCNIYPKISLV